MTETEKIGRVTKYLQAIPDEKAFSIWNKFCAETGDEVSRVYQMEELEKFGEWWGDRHVVETFGRNHDFDTSHKYFWFGDFEFPYSGDVLPGMIFNGDLSEYIIEHDEDFGNSGLRSFLNELEEAEKPEKAERS